jgi:hypothetical protein
MTNDYNLKAHLSCVGLSYSILRDCGIDYQDADHIIWSCAEYREVRFVGNIMAMQDLVSMEQMYGCWINSNRTILKSFACYLSLKFVFSFSGSFLFLFARIS